MAKIACVLKSREQREVRVCMKRVRVLPSQGHEKFVKRSGLSTAHVYNDLDELEATQ